MKNQKRTFNNIGKQNYDFDINLEKDIYSYLYALRRKQNKSLDEKVKFERYREWKQYIEKKYENFDSNRLMEFSKYLNCALGDEKSTNSYWTICIPIILTILFTKMLEMINELNAIEFDGEVIYAIVFIIIVLIFILVSTIYMLCKIVTPLFEGNIRETMLLNYKEIIDCMYGQKRAEEQKYEKIQQIAKETIVYTKKNIKAGMSLTDIRKMCEDKMFELGADSFWYWDVGAFVFAGDDTAISVSGREYKTSDRIIAENDIITIDLSPQRDNIWGDYARTLIVQNGIVVETDEVINQEWKNGLAMEEVLHKELHDYVTPQTTFEELYYHMNQLIQEKGFVNLDFMGNLGHSIVKKKEDRVYIEKGNHACLRDVAYFTFEPHISVKGSKYGYKKENIYYFDGDKLVEV